jgi:TIR domain-containing protein
MTYSVFISYPRIADRRWAVTDLQGHLQAELQLKTGDSDLCVFMDTRDIETGDVWRNGLAQKLQVVDVLLVLLAPLWLSSDVCRWELKEYRDARIARGHSQLVVPLLWDETTMQDAANEEQRAVLRELFAMQHQDWRDFKYQHSRDATYMPAVGRLADHIARKLRPKAV